MNIYSTSDNAIQLMLGKRIKSLRLKKNITQDELAMSTLLSLNTIKSLEKGHAKVSTLIAVLRELRELDELDNFLKRSEFSPIQMAKLKGKTRQRASGKSSKKSR